MTPDPLDPNGEETGESVDEVLSRLLAGHSALPALLVLRRPRILLADDSASMRLIMEDWLESAGYLVEYAEDGQTALAACLADEPPALAILDVQMPHLTGLEVGERIRGRVPFIIFSVADYKAQAHAIGAVGFMRKPPLPDDLVAMVERGLTGNAATGGDGP